MDPIEAVQMAIDDHRAFTKNHPDWNYIDGLNAALEILKANEEAKTTNKE